MWEALARKLDFTGFDDLAMARVEPWGMHLFEVLFYALFGLLVLLAFRSFWNSAALILFKPKRSELLDIATSFTYIDSNCISCGWTGSLPSFKRRCPHCGGTSFA